MHLPTDKTQELYGESTNRIYAPNDFGGDAVSLTLTQAPAHKFQYNTNFDMLVSQKDPPRVIRLMADFTTNGFWDMAYGWNMSDEDICSLGLPDSLLTEIKTTLTAIEKEMEKTLDVEIENMHRDGMEYLPEHDQTKSNELQVKLIYLANEANKVSKHKFYAE